MALPSQRVALSLFWRTFFLLLLLVGGCLTAWTAALLMRDDPPREVLAARELACVVNVSREALARVEPAARSGLLKAIAAREKLQLQARGGADRWTSAADDAGMRRFAAALRTELGPDTLVASQVNGKPGLWVGFSAERDAWWLRADPERAQPPQNLPWLLALLAVLAVILLASVLVARRINRPLRELQFAASRIREGDLDSRLDESTITSEIREVNMGFNRMARELAKVEEDRVVMLAGISHDLRTPLARLRLEAEMSVSDEEARANMADDIDQLDAIIDKFMDYARPGETRLQSVLLSRLIDKEAAAFRDPGEIRITSRVAIDLEVLADEVELGRVFANLFENARRYGRSQDTGVAEVQVSYVRTGGWVICTVRDRGPGVPESRIKQLTAPFYRGDTARTAATGAGLGLAIVEKAMARMGGTVEFHNAPDTGLMIHLRLKHARA
ncbi:ATP-binding protein [Ideonella sp. DXS22W]|uniref:histidine kinase n=1 Tax=Pseudaquabacterium inlustre TaxID=2984192 RepID=A0ABU9CJU9_9BURK